MADVLIVHSCLARIPPGCICWLKQGICKPLARIPLAHGALRCFTAVGVLALVFQLKCSWRKIFAVALMLGLHVALQSAATSEALHHCVHEDSHAPDHQCVIKLVADGHMASAPALEFVLPPKIEPFSPAEWRGVAAVGAEHLLPPGRAPPSPA